MRKKVKYNLGDVFLIELVKGLKCVGRIIKKDETTVFIVVYKIKPFENVSEIELSKLTEEPVVTMKWCYDDALRKGLWDIVGNIPVEENFEMPYFSTRGADGKYYLIKGGDTHIGLRPSIEVSEEEAQNAYAYGITNEIALPKYCISKFRWLGMI